MTREKELRPNQAYQFASIQIPKVINAIISTSTKMTTKQSELAYDLPLWHSRPSPLRDRTLSQLSISPYGTFHVHSALPIHDYKQTSAGPDLSLTAVTVAATDTKTGFFQLKQSSGRSYESLGLGRLPQARNETSWDIWEESKWSSFMSGLCLLESNAEDPSWSVASIFSSLTHPNKQAEQQSAYLPCAHKYAKR